MKEIKFRGKSAITGEWVYGYYRLIAKDKTVIYTINDEEIPIIAGTQGQYTGLKDKNRKEIYEGDLIRNDSGRICVVEWHEYAGCWDATAEKIVCKDNADGFEPVKWKHYVEVIGNIYDNKELLHSKEE